MTQFLYQNRQVIRWSSLATIVLALVGCGREGVPRVEVSGAVSLDGQPLKEGMILFSPTGEGPSASGDIREGSYEIERDAGPSPGNYRVEIRAYRDTGRKRKDAATGLMEDVIVGIIPPKYNNQSTLAVEIQPDGPNEHNFELQAK
ncbi:hypothetical protein M4951_22365 [Blastopirellula sp. J2-11]|uniref:hypothetical protein n=1 Tax=Blastopirellula sp. J2-11 TaxID=2943192 RepID=UPI0021C56BCF|nr:hypothetical protein [Blastopirellula sp. J2-11]UUO06091.1 hypothetical protein M4951_22365 [Blastopirellula sp. J2-11]